LDGKKLVGNFMATTIPDFINLTCKKDNMKDCKELKPLVDKPILWTETIQTIKTIITGKPESR